ncbi:hypothetical protein [Aquimarina algiphila]|uniref:Uncharacterized protein n=1 Tax=Aquimarina algiphila TaxID=2047982 RepID=A0A554VD78_9FLAO|nr:hypothetical protein [Aquimarina algiphila]TSE04794.1 hypothetical protein FOF46_25150 [Aquimarina algiphila]
MKNKKSYIILILTILSHGVKSQNDSLKILLINGSKIKNYKLIVQYNDSLHYKIKLKKNSNHLIKLPMPEGLEEYDALPLSIFKKSFFMYRDTHTNVSYEKNKKNLIIYDDKRVKDRYSFSFIWLDKYRTIFAPEHLGHLSKLFNEKEMMGVEE